MGESKLFSLQNLVRLSGNQMQEAASVFAVHIPAGRDPSLDHWRPCGSIFLTPTEHQLLVPYLECGKPPTGALDYHGWPGPWWLREEASC